MTRAVLLGATGSLRDTAELLSDQGWQVTATCRDLQRVPESWESRGITAVALPREDTDAIGALVDGADVLVDAMTYLPGQAQELAAWSRGVGSTVQLSSNAVYRDIASGVALTEEAERTPWAGEPLNSQHGYCANKSECERILQRDGEHVSILRLGKVQGPGCRRPREWAVVKRVLDARPAILLPGDGETRESLTSTLDLAQAILACAEQPADRVLNVADAAPLSVREMVETVIDAVVDATGTDHRPHLVASPLQSPWRLPWFANKTMDTSRLIEFLGHEPVGYRATVYREVEWLLSLATPTTPGADLPAWIDLEFFDGAFCYDDEDAFLAGMSATPPA